MTMRTIADSVVAAVRAAANACRHENPFSEVRRRRAFVARMSGVAASRDRAHRQVERRQVVTGQLPAQPARARQGFRHARQDARAEFFLVDDAWVLADLPGYGYAKASRAEKSLFNELAGDYLERRDNLRHVLVLIDSRLPPQRIDLDFSAWLATTGTAFSFVFTKADKQSPAKTGASIALFQEAVHPLLGGLPECLACSAAKRGGRDALLALMGAVLEPR